MVNYPPPAYSKYLSIDTTQVLFFHFRPYTFFLIYHISDVADHTQMRRNTQEIQNHRENEKGNKRNDASAVSSTRPTVQDAMGP